MISVDQSPIGRTPRSNPATYIGLFDQIRELFSKTQEARARGYKPGRFSFNVKGGRCEICRGDGQIKIEMHFLPDVYVPCEQCHGKRYNRETLEVRFKGKTIADVLEMPIEDALEFFAHIPKIRRRIEALNDVGLGYMRLGQPATTLSGGEAQRVKLAAELCKVATGRTLYILDEPTTGLHFADIQRLLEVLQRLVSTGNSVVVIEHNLDVIKVADRIIDLGPEGGEEGGRVIATGTPEQVAQVAESYTGRFLAAAASVGAAASGAGGSRPRRPRATSRTRRNRVRCISLVVQTSPSEPQRGLVAWSLSIRVLASERRFGWPRSTTDGCSATADRTDVRRRDRRTARGRSPTSQDVEHAVASTRRRATGGRRRAPSGRVDAHCGDRPPAPAGGLWAQKWRWYERNSLPWNRARIHWELMRREAFARWPLHGNVLEAMREGRLEVGPQVLFEPGVWITAPAPRGSRIGGGTFLNMGVMVAAAELVEIGEHCMFANGCFVTDANHRFDDPDKPVPWQGFTTKGPTRRRRQRVVRRERRDHEWRDGRRAVRDRRQLGRHRGPAAVLDRGGRAGEGAADDRVREAAGNFRPGPRRAAPARAGAARRTGADYVRVTGSRSPVVPAAYRCTA